MVKNNFPGKFIVFDSLDGSGQSTQISRLRDFLTSLKMSVITTKEPTPESEAGKKIREALDKKTKLDPMELQKLFAEDRKEHLEKTVIPALQKGEFVVSDRYCFSSFAYGASDSLNLDELIRINNNFLLPDLTFILKVSPEICISRIESRGTDKTLFERTEKLAKVWLNYSIMPDRFENIKIIDGEGTVDAVFQEVKNIFIQKFLK